MYLFLIKIKNAPDLQICISVQVMILDFESTFNTVLLPPLLCKGPTSHQKGNGIHNLHIALSSLSATVWSSLDINQLTWKILCYLHQLRLWCLFFIVLAKKIANFSVAYQPEGWSIVAKFNILPWETCLLGWWDGPWKGKQRQIPIIV